MGISIICTSAPRIGCEDKHRDITIRALKETLSVLGDKVSKIYWISDRDLQDEFGIQKVWIKIRPFVNLTNDINYITLKLIPHIATETHNLTIHGDGFAVNREAWTDEFLEYDYIGAGWQDGMVGNGGFCIRSRKLYDALMDIDANWVIDQFPQHVIDMPGVITHDHVNGNVVIPEDNIICKVYKNQLECEYGIKFAPLELADQFAIEYRFGSPWLGKSLGFHSTNGVAQYYGITL